MNGPLIVLGAALLLAPSSGALPRSGSAAQPITVTLATWGGRCGAPEGNATASVIAACHGAAVCLLDVDPERLGDPAPGCTKRLDVTFACGGGHRPTQRHASGGAGERLVLTCGNVVDVVEATYGACCGAPKGNATVQLATACEGLAQCRYVVDFEVLGDPAPGCPKDYQARWRCTAGGPEQHVSVPAEAGAKHEVALHCPAPAKTRPGAR